MNKLKYFLFIAIFINFYLVLGLVPLFNLDEGAFSEATREMLVNKDFITTYLNGDLRFDKPILIYWLQAISVSIFGLNEFALRLPSALAATGWALGIYHFAKKIYNEEVGILSAIFMVSALQISLIAKAAIADALLNMFIAFSMFSLFIYIQKRNKKYLYLAFAFVGFGFLTKGPVAILIPLATFFIYQLIRKDFKFFFKTIFDIKGILLFSIIALPWYVLEYKAQGMKFIDGFFLKHNLKRFDTSFEKHGGSLIYYIPVVLIGLLPWTSLFIKYLTKLKTFKDDFFIFGSIWFFFVFIFFSLSGTKLPHYVIYGYTPLFIFMGVVFKDIKSEFLMSLPFVLFVILLLSLPFIARSLLVLPKDEIRVVVTILLPLFNTFYFASLGVILFFSLFNFGKINKVIILASSMIFIFNYVTWIYSHVRALPLKHIAEYAKKHHLKVVMYAMNTPSFNVYAEMITPKRTPKVGEIAVMKVTNLKDLKHFKILKKEGSVVLVRVLPSKKDTSPFNYKKDRRN